MLKLIILLVSVAVLVSAQQSLDDLINSVFTPTPNVVPTKEPVVPHPQPPNPGPAPMPNPGPGPGPKPNPGVNVNVCTKY